MAVIRGQIIFRCHEKATPKTKNGDAQKIAARPGHGRTRAEAAELPDRASASPKAAKLRRPLGIRTGAGSEQLHQTQTALSAFHRRKVRRAAEWKIFRFDQS